MLVLGNVYSGTPAIGRLLRRVLSSAGVLCIGGGPILIFGGASSLGYSNLVLHPIFPGDF